MRRAPTHSCHKSYSLTHHQRVITYERNWCKYSCCTFNAPLRLNALNWATKIVHVIAEEKKSVEVYPQYTTVHKLRCAPERVNTHCQAMKNVLLKKRCFREAEALGVPNHIFVAWRSGLYPYQGSATHWKTNLNAQILDFLCSILYGLLTCWNHI